MKKYRNVIICALCAAFVIGCSAVLPGCNGGQTDDKDEQSSYTLAPSTADEATPQSGLEELGIDPASLGIDPDVYHDADNKPGFQLEMPDDGDTVAVVHTTEGDFVMRFFPEQAPKAVTNFINLAKDGKYKNTTFHKVIDDFVVQGGYVGDNPDYPNGISSYGSNFEDEFCDKLFNIRGAVSMANSSKDANGSQFFINQNDAQAFAAAGGWTAYDNLWINIRTQLMNYKDSNLLKAFVDENGDKFCYTPAIPQEVKELYEKNGGNPNLDGAFNAADRGNTVFAQVIEGMEVVDEMADYIVDTDYVPVYNIVITSIDITTYPVADKYRTNPMQPAASTTAADSSGQ